MSSKTAEEIALEVNKFIHEQCIDGVPHDIGWNVLKLINASQFKVEPNGLGELIATWQNLEKKNIEQINRDAKEGNYGRAYYLQTQVEFLQHRITDLKVVQMSSPKPVELPSDDTELLNWLESMMKKKDGYCEIFLAGLRRGEEAESYQIESNPEIFPTTNASTLREAIRNVRDEIKKKQG
jgi:hypothetical protein